MLNKYIIRGCECWLTAKTYEEVTRLTPEDEVWLAEKRWRETRDPELWDYFSDLHKDVYGIRPHGYH